MLDDGVGGRGERYGDQRAGDAGDEHAGSDRDDHAERVHRDEAAHQERLEHVALDLLHEHHAAEHQQRDDDAVVDQGDQDRDRAGDERTDDRDERAEEDQHADRAARTAPAGSRRAIMMPTASVTATITVARTNWVSEIQATRPELSTRARAARGESRTNQAQIRSPSARKKYVENSTMKSPARMWAERGADLGDLAEEGAALRLAPSR